MTTRPDPQFRIADALERIATALEKTAEAEPACDHACESCEQEHDAAVWASARGGITG